MPATTTQGVPYPLGTDRVSDGDNAIQAVAQWLDSSLCFGACTLTADTGPGAGSTLWFTSCNPIGASGGAVVSANGITVPRKGWYQLMATGLINWGQVAGGSTTALLIGDGANPWAVGQVVYDGNSTPQLKHTAVAMTVVNLPANTLVRWAIQNVGPTGGGLYAGAAYSVLFVRLLIPLA